MERFRAAYRYFACPQRKGGNKSTVDFKKKEKGKLSSKKPVKSDCLATNCCILGESTEKVNTEKDQSAKSDEMELTSQRCIVDNDSLLVNELGLSDHGQDSSSLSTAREGSELEQKPAEKQGDLTPSETSLKKELSQCNCIGSLDGAESAGKDCRSNLEMESSHQIVCNNLSATSCNCKATEAPSDFIDDDDNLPSQELYYVFDKFILTSGKVGYGKQFVKLRGYCMTIDSF